MDSYGFWFEECWCYLSKSYDFGLLFIGKLVEIYIDDVVVKSGDFTKHLADLQKILECTRRHGLKMNPNKCAFGVSAGQFLGFCLHRFWARVQDGRMRQAVCGLQDELPMRMAADKGEVEHD